MLVRESISFQKKQNPKNALGVSGYNIIKEWLETYFQYSSNGTRDSKYIIRDDLTIDINGFFATTWIGNFPEYIRFNEIKGNFQLSGRSFLEEGNKMTSLKGCPKIVHGNFDCSYNHLKNLIGGPIEVDDVYTCSLIPTLESLEGLAKYIGGGLNCNNKSGLTKKDIPKTSIVKGGINVHYWSDW